MQRLSKLERAAVDQVYALFGPLRLRNCPLTPTPRQEAFLLLNAFEVFFGGAASGGKTAALLIAAPQYSDAPGHHALLVRPYPNNLQLPGRLNEPSHHVAARIQDSCHNKLKQVCVLVR